MRCLPALCCSILASSPPNRCYAQPWRSPSHVTHHHGHVASPTAGTPPHTNSQHAQRPAGGGLGPPALRAHSQGFRGEFSASLRHFAAVYRRFCSCPCFTPLPVPHVACLPLSSTDLAVRSPIRRSLRHPAARARPAAVERRGRSPVVGPGPSTLHRIQLWIYTVTAGSLRSSSLTSP